MLFREKNLVLPLKQHSATPLAGPSWASQSGEGTGVQSPNGSPVLKEGSLLPVSFADLTFTLPLQHSKLPLTSTSYVFKTWLELHKLKVMRLKDRAKVESDSLTPCSGMVKARAVLVKGQGFLVALGSWPYARERIWS